ncbi:MAG: nucleotidyltransferase domain-containing protein [Candidatus Rokuibacteriota bacterium]
MTPHRRQALERVKQIVLTALAGQDATIYLFGSSVAGLVRHSSDIDIAIEPRGPLSPRTLADLREALEESAIPYDVELVDLSQAAPEFRARVIREGVPWRD